MNGREDLILKKQLLKYLLVGACITGLLAGCGQTTTQTGAAADTQESTTDVVAEGSSENVGVKPAENITLRFSFQGSETDKNVYEKRAALYEETHPGITVETIYFTDYPTQLQTMAAGGECPDVMQLEERIISFANQGALLPLNDYIEKAGLDLEARVGKTNVEKNSYQGQVYGVADRGGSMMLFYNKDLFDKYGVEYPTEDWTWDDMLAAAQKMTAGSGEEETWGYAQSYWWAYHLNWIYQAGGKVMDENGNFVMNTPESVEALTFLRDLTGKYDVMPSREEYANMGSGANHATLFAAGKVGMVLDGMWLYASLQDSDFEVGVSVPWGGKEKVTTPFGSALAISSACKYPEQAFDFINFMTDVQGQELIVENIQDVPANMEVLNSDAFKNAPWSSHEIDFDQVIKCNEMTYVPPIGPNWTTWDAIINEEMTSIYDGTGDPQEVLDRIEKRVNEE